eukprot:scaffold33550_cov114-Skeletonema_dohrnii-CCMP3373.AAC.5
MEQSTNDAAVMDAHTKLRKEDYALSTGHKSRRSCAAVKAAQIMLRMEECASGMVQVAKYAAAKDARVMPEVEECVLNMGTSELDGVLSLNWSFIRRMIQTAAVEVKPGPGVRSQTRSSEAEAEEGCLSFRPCHCHGYGFIKPETDARSPENR